MDKKQYAVVLTLAVVAGLLGGVVSSFLFVGTPVFAQKTDVAEVIRAERFEVVDENGMLRALLSLGTDGEPGLRLYDKNGQHRAALSLLNNGEPRLGLYDKDGSRAVLGVVDGEPRLWFFDQNGKYRAALVLNADEEPRLSFIDKNGNVIWRAP